MMKVLVTGGAGYIGSVTVEMLLNAGHEVTIFDNLERGHRRALDSRARFMRGDLRAPDEIAQAMADTAPAAVMHFAAYALVGESMAQPELYFTNNIGGALNLAEAMRRQDVRQLVFSSTCATYGEPDRMPISEQTPQAPTNPYGDSKLMCEKMFRWYAATHGWRTVFLRYFNACGATATHGEDHTPETHLIPNIMRVALDQEPCLRIFGGDYATPDGTCIRDYIHIEDLARAHVTALTSDQAGAFNLGTGSGCSVGEIVAAARRITCHPLPVQIMPRRPGDPPRLVADYAKARRALDWEPRASAIENIIRTAWDWHRRHPRGYQDNDLDP